MKETIAQLTGVLKFNVESAGFQRFNRMMQSANKQLSALAKEYEQLSKAMAKGLKLRVDSSAIDKAKTKLDAALKRQQRAEAALGNQQRQVFTAELTQQKLKYAGTQAQNQLNSKSLQYQKDSAILAAKAQAAANKAQGVTKQQLASQSQLTAALAKQARLESIMAKTRAATQKANAQHLASMTKLQRIQQQMNHAQQQAHIRAQQAATKAAAAQQTAANKAQNASQSAARFQMSQQRHAAWQARQSAPAPSGGLGNMFGHMSGGMLAFGGLGAAVAALTVAASKLGERIEQRKAGVVDAEAFEGSFTPLGKTAETRKMWRDEYIKLSNKTGAPIDNDSAKEFSSFVQMQSSKKTPDQILAEYERRRTAMTISGLNREQGQRLNRQLNQMSGGDQRGDKADWNEISENDTLLAKYVMKAYGEKAGIKDDDKSAAEFNKKLKKGEGFSNDLVVRAQEMMIAENQDTLAAKRKGVAYSQTLADSQSFLNEVGINNSAELNEAMRDNIQAHRELNEALQPTKQLLKDFDEGLTQAQTGLIRFAIGLNQDGSKKTEQQQIQERMTTQDLPVDLSMVGTHDYSSIDGNTQHQGGPIGNFWNWALGIKDKRNEYKKQAKDLIPDTLGQQASMPGIVPQFQISADTIKQMADLYSRHDSPSSSSMSAASSASNAGPQISAPVTIEGSTIHIELHGSATDEDRAKIMDAVTTRLDERTAALTMQMPALADNAIRNAFGAARAQQAERQ
jgi:hypothetical protein